MEFLNWLRAEWDRVLGWSAVTAGAIALVLGVAGVGDSPFVARQLNYIISGGITGLFLLGIGAALLLSADLHDEWRKLDRIDDALSEQNRLLTQTPAETRPMVAERSAVVR